MSWAGNNGGGGGDPYRSSSHRSDPDSTGRRSSDAVPPPGGPYGSREPRGECVEVSVAGAKLRDMDLFSKSDPFVVLYVRRPGEDGAAVGGGVGATADVGGGAGAWGASAAPPDGWDSPPAGGGGGTRGVSESLPPASSLSRSSASSGGRVKSASHRMSSATSGLLGGRGGGGGSGTSGGAVASPSILPPDLVDYTTPSGELWRYAGRTETVWNDLDPIFITKFYLPHGTDADGMVRLRFVVYDQDDESGSFKRQDFIGMAEVELSGLLRASAAGATRLMLADKKQRVSKKLGALLLAAQPLSVSPPVHRLELGLLFTSGCEFPQGESIFFVLSRRLRGVPTTSSTVATHDGEGASWTRVHRSGPMIAPPTVRDEFRFQDVALTEEQLCAGDRRRPLRLEVYVHRHKGDHVRVAATAPFSLAALEGGAGGGRGASGTPTGVGRLVLLATDAGWVAGGEIVANTHIVRREGAGGGAAGEGRTHPASWLGGGGGRPRSARDGGASEIVFRVSKLTWTRKGTTSGGGLLQKFKSTKF